MNPVVAGFRTMQPEALAAVASELSLGIGVGELAFLRDHYRSNEAKDPEICELELLGRIIASSEKHPSSILLTELKTDDAELFECFEDLKKKLTALGKKPPFSFYDIATAADKYLARAGKKTGTPSLYGKCGDMTELEFYAKGCRPILHLSAQSGSSCTLGVPTTPPYSHASASESDSFIVISRADPEERLDVFYQKLSEILSAPEINSSVKSVKTLERGDLIQYMLSVSTGVYADITNFPGCESNNTPLLLTESRNDAVIALADGRSIMSISTAVADKGLKFAAFGRPLGVPKLTVRHAAPSPTTLNAELIRNMRFTANLSAFDESPRPELELADGCRFECGEALSLEHIICAAAVTDDASLADTADTVIAAVAPLVARGADFERISVSFDVRLPLLGFDRAHAHAALSMLAAKYRVQAELSLVSEGSRIRATKNELSLVAYARAEEPSAGSPDRVTADRGQLFIIAPHRRGSLVDFSELRELFRHIRSLVESGRATAVRAVGREGIYAALSKMAEFCELSPYELPSELREHPVGAFIVESDEELSGIRVDYKTVENPEI